MSKISVTGENGVNITVTPQAPRPIEIKRPGVQGIQGDKGDQGDAATIAVGTVTTVGPGDPAAVTNVGTPQEAVFDFSIPRGQPGVVHSVVAGSNVTVNSTDPANPVVNASGSVSSVAMTVPTGLSVSGSPITTSGTFALSYASGYQGYTTSEASKLSGIEAGADVTDAGNVSPVLTAYATKTTPVDADAVLITDSAASGAPKRTLWSQIKATLKTYFDTLYPPVARTISAGTGLTGGGDLSANRSFAVSYGTAAGTAAQGNDSRITGAMQKATYDPTNREADVFDAANTQYLGLGGSSFAVLRSVQSALRDRRPSITDYGVGTHGFKGAMDRAVAAAPSTGQAVYIPAGNWTVEETIKVAKAGVIIEGAGDGTYIYNAQTNAPAIQLGPDTGGMSSVWRLGARDLLITTAPGVTGVSGQLGLLVKNAAEVELRNIRTGTGIHSGIWVEAVYLIVADRVLTQGALAVGQRYRNVASLCLINSESIASGTEGLLFEGVEGIWSTNVHSYGSGNRGIVFGSHASRRNKNNFLVNWVADTSGSHNWYAVDLNSTTLVGAWAATQLDPGVNTSATGFFLATEAVFGLQFMGGKAGNNNGHGVQIWGDTTFPRDIEFHGFDFGPEFGANGKGGVSGGRNGLWAAASCTGVRVFGGRNIGNPEGAFNSVGIDLIRDVNGYVNSRRMSVTGTTDASGDLTFSHGMQETPVTVICVFEGTTAQSAQATAKTSSQVTVRVHDAAGAAITNTSVTFTAIMAGARA